MSTARTSPLPFARVMAATIGLLALLALQVAAPAPASAHARLEATSPSDGASLTAAPPEVMLRFNEEVNADLSEVSVSSGSTDVATGAPEAQGSSLHQPLDTSMAEGDYTVTYKVVSEDGHPISGSFGFTYAPPAAEEQEGEVVDPPTESTGPSGSDGEGATEGEGSEGETPEGETTGSESATEGEGSTEDGSAEPTEGSDESGPTSSADDTEASPASEEGEGSAGVPSWVWGAGAVGVVLVLAAVALLSRGRRTTSEEEDDTLEDWRG